jgi:hypothetical protein
MTFEFWTRKWVWQVELTKVQQVTMFEDPRSKPSMHFDLITSTVVYFVTYRAQRL